MTQPPRNRLHELAEIFQGLIVIAIATAPVWIPALLVISFCVLVGIGIYRWAWGFAF